MGADLPRELACGIDVETSIPKLSPLPPGAGAVGPSGGGAGGGSGLRSVGGDDDVFSTRASIDAIFHSQNNAAGQLNRHDKADVLLAGFDDGTVYIRIFDCFDIGKIDLRSSMPEDSEQCKVIQHVAHPLSSTHALIVRTSTKASGEKLHVIALDLNFVPQTRLYYLSTLATKSTQLLNLLRYLTQVSTLLSIELRGTFDLPSKFIRNINETLAGIREEPTDFVTAAYQLIVVGECRDELRDWMIDEIGERNLKRWEKASVTGMDNIRKFVHECLLPAVERCQVVLSRLEGLSRFGRSAHVLGLDTQGLNGIMDTLKCLNLLSHFLLKTVGKEMKQFTAFIKWLRLEVEIQALERENAGGTGSERLENTCMRRDEIEVRTVLDYIQGVMGKSEINAFLRPSVDPRGSSLEGPSYEWSSGLDDVDFYTTFKRMLPTPAARGKRPHLDDLVRRLRGQAEKVFDSIAQTLRKSVLHSMVCALDTDCETDMLSSRMMARADEGYYDLVLATKKRVAPNQVFIHRIPWEAAHRNDRLGFNVLALTSTESTIVDMDCLDDEDLMVLSAGKDTAYLHTLSYTSEEPTWRARHTFDLRGGGKAPSEVEVESRKGRRVACVLTDDSRLTVFDLDDTRRDEGSVGQGQGQGQDRDRDRDRDEDEDVIMQ